MSKVGFDSNAQQQTAGDAVASQQPPPVALSHIAQHVLTAWQAAKEAKEREIEPRMIQALYDIKGEYPPHQKAIIMKEGSKTTVFSMLTAEKVNAAIALLSDILFQPGTRLCAVKETPIPELPESYQQRINEVVQQKAMTDLKAELSFRVQSGEITNQEQATGFLLSEMNMLAEQIQKSIKIKMEEAASEARRLAEDKIYDVLLEAGWEDALRDVIEDVVSFPAGILKGPVLRRKKVLSWQGNVPTVKEEIHIDFNSPSPFDIYPLIGSQKPEDGLIERHRLTRSYLTSLIGVPGYDEAAIRSVLSSDRGSMAKWLTSLNDTVRFELENRPMNAFGLDNDDRIDALQYWGDISGAQLLSYGFDPSEIDPILAYPCEVWLINHHVIKVAINQDPLGSVPYSFVSFRRQKGSLWGLASIPDLCRDALNVCNSAARHIIHNMALSSGPQVVYDVSQLPDGINLGEIKPFKIWTLSGDKALGSTSTRKPVDFFVVPSVAQELLEIYRFYSEEADTRTGIPKYSYGSQGSGDIQTATGLSMMLKNALKSIKLVISNFDSLIIRPSVQRTCEMLLLHFNSPEVMLGDIQLKAIGASALIAKEVVQLRRNELFQVLATNPMMLNLVGEEILTEVFIEVFRGADIPFEVAVKDRLKEHIKQQQQTALVQHQAAQQQASQPAQANIPQRSNDAGHRHAGQDFQLMQKRSY